MDGWEELKKNQKMKLKIKLIIAAVITALIITLGITIGAMAKQNKSWREKYELVQQTSTMYFKDLQSAKNDIHQYELTLADLQFMNDSITNKLLDLQKELKIKDKHVQNLQYMYSHFTKTDTLLMNDTIFLDVDFCLDTVLGDQWVENNLHLEYPGEIKVSTRVQSKKSVIIYLKREPINPPKKTWIGRLFQKKRKVARVFVNEENPYIDDQQNLFIDVVKK